MAAHFPNLVPAF